MSRDDGRPAEPGRELRSNTPLLELDEIVVRYGLRRSAKSLHRSYVHAVSGVTLSVQTGTTLGIVGESGCGKSSLARAIVGLENLASGQIRFDDTDIATARGARRRNLRRDMQLMFQDPFSSLDPRMSVGSILREPMRIQGLGTPHDRKAQVTQLLAEVGLPADVASRRPHEFSGGQRQRIGFARAIALSPRLIVADEPVSALDVSVRAQILNLMRRVQANRGTTYVLISHDLTVIRHMSDRICVMYLGKIVEIGRSEDVYQAPIHPYTDALVHTALVPDPRYERTKTRAAIHGELPSAVFPPSGCRFRTRCPRARDICSTTEPPLTDYGDGHLAACHFPLRPPNPSPTGNPPSQQRRTAPHDP